MPESRDTSKPNIDGASMDADLLPTKSVIIFDGVCYLCDASIHFILRRDTQQQFVFTPLQSEFAQKLMSEYEVSHLVENTFILVKQGECYFQSDAAIEISKSFSGAWKWLRFLRAIPRPIRDFVYTLVAKNRYRLFGRSDTCILPSAELKKRLRN